MVSLFASLRSARIVGFAPGLSPSHSACLFVVLGILIEVGINLSLVPFPFLVHLLLLSFRAFESIFLLSCVLVSCFLASFSSLVASQPASVTCFHDTQEYFRAAHPSEFSKTLSGMDFPEVYTKSQHFDRFNWMLEVTPTFLRSLKAFFGVLESIIFEVPKAHEGVVGSESYT